MAYLGRMISVLASPRCQGRSTSRTSGCFRGAHRFLLFRPQGAFGDAVLITGLLLSAVGVLIWLACPAKLRVTHWKSRRAAERAASKKTAAMARDEHDPLRLPSAEGSKRRRLSLEPPSSLHCHTRGPAQPSDELIAGRARPSPR